MEKDLGSWFHHQYPDHLNFSSCGQNIGQQNSGPIYMTPHLNEVPVKGGSPNFSSKASQSIEHCSWFYCLPQFHQGFGPQSADQLGEEANAAPVLDQKRFLVFDQSGDQTTLLYSSSNGTPAECLPLWNPKPTVPCSLVKQSPQIKTSGIFPFGHYLNDEYNEENLRGDDVESDMHEDTEELNALLYSDDDTDCSVGCEEVSTGHSPSTMTAHALPQWFEEEVASSAGPTKRQKQLDPVKPFTCSDLEDDAESSCGNNSDNRVSETSVSQSSKKRPRKDDIRETISILQTIIPGGGKGKDSIVVIDEAIHYLRSLKVKVKSLGLDNL